MRANLSFQLLLFSLALSGCQTSREASFDRVKQGMQKDLVLEAVGSPDISRRWQGKDRWIYHFPTQSEGNQVREVHFEEGKAVYIGNKIVPAVSAEEQDRINAEKEIAAQKREKENADSRAEFYGVTQAGGEAVSANSSSRQNQFLKNFDLNDQKLYESFYGSTPQMERNKVAPNFEEVVPSDEGQPASGAAQ